MCVYTKAQTYARYLRSHLNITLHLSAESGVLSGRKSSFHWPWMTGYTGTLLRILIAGVIPPLCREKVSPLPDLPRPTAAHFSTIHSRAYAEV
jgi:hypothetical protein